MFSARYALVGGKIELCERVGPLPVKPEENRFNRPTVRRGIVAFYPAVAAQAAGRDQSQAQAKGNPGAFLRDHFSSSSFKAKPMVSVV
jgi:hypothetical protein